MAACLRFRTLQTLLRWGTAVPVVVLAFFVFASPASGLIITPDTVLQETSGVGNPVPVVVLVLDELPVQTLMNAEGNIDDQPLSRLRQPPRRLHLVPQHSHDAPPHHKDVLPMILTGVPARRRSEPSTLGYPNNLFTMMGNSHDVWAHEEVDGFLWSRTLCREQPHPRCARTLAALARRHGRRHRSCSSYPTAAASWLPLLDTAWTGLRAGRAHCQIRSTRL